MRSMSAATRLFATIVLAAALTTAALAVFLVLDAQRSEREEAERVTSAVARTLAGDPFVAEHLVGPDPTTALQPFATAVVEGAGVDFVTIMRPNGERVTHRDPAEIGGAYLGTVPAAARVLTEEYTGTLGPSLRTIAPVEQDGVVVGWVSVGVTLGSIASGVAPRLPLLLGAVTALLAAGLIGATLARRIARHVAGDLAASEIRDTLSSAESMRTLSDALRAQTHEHGNRVHTAVALIDLGRADEAIEVLTDSARSSQDLVDQVTGGDRGDSAVGALLLGKTSEAKERGVQLVTRLDPEGPRSTLSPVDAVTVVGNLIDNAVDAAAAADEPRTVRVEVAGHGGDAVAVTVSDSGPGVPPGLRKQVFVRGFSTKPAGPEGRGLGLALVHAIVESAGGSIRIDDQDPSMFRVVLPRRRSS